MDGAYRFGRVPRLTVREWLGRNALSITGLPYVLVSSMDSQRDVGSMPWAAARMAGSPAWALSMSPLVISGASVIELLADPGLFTGFDEIWIPLRIPIGQPPGAAYLGAPRRLDTEAPPAILEWIRDAGCRLGVGDGDGLNYAVGNDPDLAFLLGLG